MYLAPPGSIWFWHPHVKIRTDIFTKWYGRYFYFVKPHVHDPVLLIGDGHLSQPNTVIWRTKPGKTILALLDFRPFLHKIFSPLNLISWSHISCVRDRNVVRQVFCPCVTLFVVFKLLRGCLKKGSRNTALLLLTHTEKSWIRGSWNGRIQRWMCWWSFLWNL